MPAQEPQGPLRPPPGATPELAAILSAISDPADRDAIVRAWHELSEGVEDHALTQAAALFGGVLRAHEARIRQIIAPRPAASQGSAGEELPGVIAEEVARTLAPLIQAQGNRTEAAAKNTNTKFLTIAIGTAFLLGGLIGAWLFHSH